MMERAGHLTAKCDIYSFGVVLLELLSGRPAVDKSRVRLEQTLVDWAKPCLGDPRKLIRVMDIKLEGQYPKKGAFMVALLALECLADAKNRPSMGDVLDRLKKVPVPKEAAGTGGQSEQEKQKQSISIPSPKSSLTSPSGTPTSASSSPFSSSDIVPLAPTHHRSR